MKKDPPSFRVWALDDAIYGPVALEILRGWVLDERISAESWVFCDQTRRWMQAGDLPGLGELFGVGPTPAEEPAFRAAALRRVRAFGALDDEQLGVLAKLGERVHFPAFATVLRAGAPGDSAYFVLEGQVRQRIVVQGREILIGIQEVGGVFGQISLLDGLPRVTDVVSDCPVTLFHLSAGVFRALCADRPDIGAPILLALGRTLAARIRSDDKHLCEMVAMSESSG